SLVNSMPRRSLTDLDRVHDDEFVGIDYADGIALLVRDIGGEGARLGADEDEYRVPEILTLGRFPDADESDSTWRTQEVRHVGSDTIAPRFWCVPAAWFGEEDERRPSGPSASGARRNL